LLYVFRFFKKTGKAFKQNIVGSLAPIAAVMLPEVVAFEA